MNWMGRMALELVGQGGLGYSFDPLVEDVPNKVGEAIKATMCVDFSIANLWQLLIVYLYCILCHRPAIAALGPLRVLAPLADKYVPVALRRTLAQLNSAVHGVTRVSDTMDAAFRAIYHAKKAEFEKGGMEKDDGRGKDLMDLICKFMRCGARCYLSNIR